MPMERDMWVTQFLVVRRGGWGSCCVARANHMTVRVQPRHKDRIRNEQGRHSETGFQVTKEVRASEIRIWNKIDAN